MGDGVGFGVSEFMSGLALSEQPINARAPRQFRKPQIEDSHSKNNGPKNILY
jgi:hypothetical protein